jgi:hypothetical protein
MRSVAERSVFLVLDHEARVSPAPTSSSATSETPEGNWKAKAPCRPPVPSHPKPRMDPTTPPPSSTSRPALTAIPQTLPLRKMFAQSWPAEPVAHRFVLAVTRLSQRPWPSPPFRPGFRFGCPWFQEIEISQAIGPCLLHGSAANAERGQLFATLNRLYEPRIAIRVGAMPTHAFNAAHRSLRLISLAETWGNFPCGKVKWVYSKEVIHARAKYTNV